MNLPSRPSLTFAGACARAAADHRTLGRAFLQHVRRGPHKPAIVDAQGHLSRLRLAGVALALLPRLDLADNEERVGVLLPAGRGGTLVNVALALGGRTAINLNHTVGDAQLARMCALADLRTVITADVYLDRIGRPELPGRVVLLDALLPSLPKWRIAASMVRVMALSSRRLDQARPDDLATIIFSSGSTAEPKGVMLTHRQVLANCDAVVEHLEIKLDEDVLLSPLPLFHAFGLLPGLWLGLVNGVTVAGQADPTDGTALGRLAAATGATFLISTPTFVRGYLRRVTPDQFATLRFAVVGAEKCPEDLRRDFRVAFERPLLEGYGATELGPAASVNTPDRQRDGSVGRPLPGIEVFTVDPDSQMPLPAGTVGVLAVRSAARMLGYLHRDDLTRRALIGDAYYTGDMGHVDDDGFVHITGRLARFAKVAGEMVPLDLIEETIQCFVTRQYGDDWSVAVAAVADPRRGERLIVLHTGVPCGAAALLETLEDLPPIFRPRPKDVFQVDAIPVLGTGKRDLGGVKALAARTVAAAEAAPA